MAPVHEDSVLGLGFCAVGSGCAVLRIQSALPAVSALLLSKSTRCTAVAGRGAATGTAARGGGRTTGRAPVPQARRIYRCTALPGQTPVNGGGKGYSPAPPRRG